MVFNLGVQSMYSALKKNTSSSRGLLLLKNYVPAASKSERPLFDVVALLIILFAQDCFYNSSLSIVIAVSKRHNLASRENLLAQARSAAWRSRLDAHGKTPSASE